MQEPNQATSSGLLLNYFMRRIIEIKIAEGMQNMLCMVAEACNLVYILLMMGHGNLLYSLKYSFLFVI